MMSLYAYHTSCYMNCSCCFVELLADVKELMMVTDLSSLSSNMERAGIVFQPLIDYSLVNVLTSVYEALNRNELVLCVQPYMCVSAYACMCCTHVYVCIGMCICEYYTVYVHVHVCLCAVVCTHVCVCVCVLRMYKYIQ